MPGEIEVILPCPPHPLLKGVKNVDRLGKLGDVEDAVLCASVDADLLDARPDARHRLPIVRLQAALHSPELESGNLPGGVWKAPDLVSGVPEPDQRLFGHDTIYKNLDAASKPDTRANGRSHEAGQYPMARRLARGHGAGFGAGSASQSGRARPIRSRRPSLQVGDITSWGTAGRHRSHTGVTHFESEGR